MQLQNAVAGFEALPLSPRTQARLKDLGFTVPTPIQAAAIPPALEGRDVIGLAQTGTGKTLAFGLPLLENLGRAGRALILTPTRELAAQVEDMLRQLGLRCTLIVGGAAMGPQVRALAHDPQIIVATPGRLMDHMQTARLRLGGITHVVLDEADRMLDVGFAPAVRRILSTVRKDRQTLLFSATLAPGVADLAREFLRDPVRVEIGVVGSTADTVQQELVVVQTDQRGEMLRDVLAAAGGSALVFVRTRHGARKIARAVSHMGHATAELHSDRTLPQRRAAMSAFKNGDATVLVATDIAARGIDVVGVALVVNYDLPDAPEDYVHRIGRTGRAGLSGKSITFASPEQAKEVFELEKTIGKPIPVSSRSQAEMPVWPPRRQPHQGAQRSGPRRPRR